MIVRRLEDVVGTERDVRGDGWASRRFLVRADRMGFSLNDTLVEAGAEFELEYRNHLEACYCIDGEGEIEDLATGERHIIEPGTLYALDRHDRHVVRARTGLRLVSVFNPALVGDETHDAEGGYRSAED